MEQSGCVAFVLHAHLPYVRHPDFDLFLEEDWLYEAITESYLPLLEVLWGLERDRVPYHLTMVFSPTLVCMLRDDLLVHRYRLRLQRDIELAGKEVERTRKEAPLFHPVAKWYLQRYERFHHIFNDVLKGDLLTPFSQLQDQGHLEIATCAATHVFLPNFALYPEVIRAQLTLACEQHRKVFKRSPKGIWLPECGLFPGVEEYLAEEDLRYFIADAHGILHSTPRPQNGTFAPIFCPNGVAVFGRDLEGARQVWSSKEGYPGDFDYREFYRDIGWDLDMELIAPYILPTGHRKNTGIKYYRITGTTDEKEVYDPDRARDKALIHAQHFVASRARQAEWAQSVIGKNPIMVCPYDAELFGHWWFEGPLFLDGVLRELAKHPTLEAVTPSSYLTRYPTHQVAKPAMSSWGDQGFAGVWINRSNDWIYKHLHKAAEEMISLANSRAGQDGLVGRALNQAAREILLAQASDWAFIINAGTMVPYALKRTQTHLLRFRRLVEQIRQGLVDQFWLEEVERRDNIFPDLNFQVFTSRRRP